MATKVPFCGEVMTMEKALETISDRANVLFSHDVKRTDREKEVSLPKGEVSVQHILVDLLGEQCQFRQIGSHIVLTLPSAPYTSSSQTDEALQAAQKAQDISSLDSEETKGHWKPMNYFYAHPKTKKASNPQKIRCFSILK